MSTATARFLVLSAEPQTLHGRPVRTRNRAGRASRSDPRPLAHGVSASHVTVGQLRRNAVGAHGVKLGAAPDAPPWGKVLACLPPVPVRTQRRAVAARDIHPPQHRHTHQARPVRGGAGCKTERTFPAVRTLRGLPAPVLVPALGVTVPAGGRDGGHSWSSGATWMTGMTRIAANGCLGVAYAAHAAQTTTAAIANCITSSGPAERPEHDSGWQ
jgi:hypothetical protein